MAFIFRDFAVTANFTYKELVHSHTADYLNLNNTPSDNEILFNLFSSARKLQLLRDFVFHCPIRIHSGYRSFSVNRAVGGVKTSDHLKGLAFDIVVQGLSPYEVFKLIHEYHLSSNDFLFGQVICYPSFVHVSFNRERHKDEFFCKDLL